MVENHKTDEKEKTGLSFSPPGREGISVRAGPRGPGAVCPAGAGAGASTHGTGAAARAGARVTALLPKLLCGESKSCRR